MLAFFAESRRRNLYRLIGSCAVILFLGSAAQPATDPAPNFAPNDHTSWHPDRPDGDNFLPPESGPGPFCRARDILTFRTVARILLPRIRLIGLPI
jgi:hypothetical protein